MKLFKHIPFLLFILAITGSVGCDKDDPFTEIQVPDPSAVAITVTNTGDDAGALTITPTAEGAAYFTLDFGDGSAVETLDIGESAMHTYNEGDYTLTATAFNVTGASASATTSVNVSLDPPSNLTVDITIDPVNTNVVTVTPSADNALTYDVFFGDVTDEEATIVADGNNAIYTYAETGEYEVRVVAKSGSITTVEYSETISVVKPAAQLALPIDFEDPELDYSFISFGNADVAPIANPDMNGNTSNNVARLFKASGAEVWAGGVITIPSPIDFSSETTLTMDVWSPKAGAEVLVKLENLADNNIFVEVMTATTTSNSWETLSFDFSSIDQSSTYQKIVVFMDFGIVGDDSEYFFDNIALGEGDGGGGSGGGDDDPLTIPVDFESSTVDYAFTSFGNASADVIDNPDASGGNTSTKVGHINKASGAEVWAGTFLTLEGPIDFSVSTTISMNSWSPKSGAAILMKIENSADSDIFVEIEVPTTTDGSWETLSFDFSSIDATQSYDRIVIFYDFGVAGDNSDYYFDDINL